MKMFTADEVKNAMIGAEIGFAIVHKCSLCGYQCGYQRINGDLFYDSGCWCTMREPEPREWEAAADFLNRQTNPEVRERLATAFGIKTLTTDSSAGAERKPD